MRFYNVGDGTCAEAYDEETGECILRRLYDPETDTDLQPALEFQRTFLIKKLASLRYDAETSGIDIPGIGHVATDRQSQAMLTGALVAAPNAQTQWKIANGTFVTTTPADLAPYVVAHIQECFANEASLYEQLTAAQTIEDLDAIDITSGF
jgi:hypothetical protein